MWSILWPGNRVSSLKSSTTQNAERKTRKQSPDNILRKRQGSTAQADSISNNHSLQQWFGFGFTNNDCKEIKSLIIYTKSRTLNLRETLRDTVPSGFVITTSATLQILLHPRHSVSALQALINQVLASASYKMQYHVCLLWAILSPA